MAVIFSHAGGSLKPLYPCPTFGEFLCPDMHRIAWEHVRGAYSLPGIFAPTPIHEFYVPYQNYQAAAVKDAKVGSILVLSVVPPRHEITAVAVEVGLVSEFSDMRAALAPTGSFDWGAAAGVTVDVVALLFKEVKDPATGAINYSCDVDTKTVIAAGVKMDEQSWKHYPLPLVTQDGERVGIAIEIKSMPTSGAGLNEISSMLGTATRVFGFDTPRSA